MNVKTAILAYDTNSLFELSCAVELFALPRPEYEDWYNGNLISFTQSPLRTTGGMKLIVESVSDLADYDLLIIPSWPVNAGTVDLTISNEILKLYDRGGRIISFCSGSFLLAELGLLQNRTAISHWRYSDIFRRRFPQVSYRDDVLYTYDGRIGCSAGSAAALDLGLAVIREDYGYERANEVAKRLVLPAHRQGGQAQYTQTPILNRPNNFSQSLEWAKSRIKDDIGIEEWSKVAQMSRRSFDRKFRSSLGMSPKEWIVGQRIEIAKHLLETSDLSLDLIASGSGFGTVLNMRNHFKKRLTCSPKEYQRQFSKE